jgi:O-methyltransferase
VNPHIAKRARDLTALAARVSGVEGAFVECGVQNGFSAAIIAKALGSRYGCRHVWLFDSFEGLPRPFPVDGERALISYLKNGPRWCKGSADTVHETFQQLCWSEDCLHIVPGWFHETVETVDPGPIAFLHLDADFYEATLLCLRHFWDQVVPGGIVRIDDYYYWPGCRKATDEFLASRGLDPAALAPAGLDYWYTVKAA